MEQFRQWLQSVKGLGERSARDVSSRVKRVQTMLETELIAGNTLDILEQNEEFKQISMSVKSQLRRSIKLYLEFKN